MLCNIFRLLILSIKYLYSTLLGHRILLHSTFNGVPELGDLVALGTSGVNIVKWRPLGVKISDISILQTT